jgi:nitrate reductase assembly molybdenum cofactor insertion protein NarJ
LRDAVAAALTEAAEGLYHSVLGPGGPAPAREVSYRDVVQFGGLMSELACYYDAFAYQPTDREPGDHVSVEADFLGYLRLKEAYALASGDAEHAEVTSEAATAFIADHLSFIAEPLAGSLGHSGIRYLAIAGEALLQRTGPRRVSGV